MYKNDNVVCVNQKSLIFELARQNSWFGSSWGISKQLIMGFYSSCF
jgi:hypothetical protein